MKGAEKEAVKSINKDQNKGYDNSELMSAIKGLSLTPQANGLNAAATAGVDIAH